MTQKQIEYFLEVFRQGSVSRAATLLYVSRPVISRSLHELEETVGARLFDRTLSGLEATEAGNILYSMFDEFIRVYDLTIKRLSSGDVQNVSQRIRIGICNGCGAWFYPLIYKKLKQLHPNAAISVEGVSMESSISMLVSGEIDAAITPLFDEAQFSLNSIQLYTAQWVLCAPKTSFYQSMSEISIDRCRTLTLAILETLPPPFYAVSDIILKTREPDMVRMAVSSGFACAALPYEICGAWDDVHCVLFQERVLAPMYLIWNKSIPHNAVFDSLINTVNETDFEPLQKSYGLYIPPDSDRLSVGELSV